MDTSFLDGIQEEDEDQASLFAQAALNDLKDRVSSLRDAIEHNNLPEAAQYAHAMKSVAANIGAQDFSDMAREVEMLCKDGDDNNKLASLAEDMNALFSGIEDTLKGYIKA